MMHFYLAGGLWMHIIVVLGLGGLGLAGVQAALPAGRGIVPLVLAAVTLTLGAGVVGTLHGLVQMFEALAAVDPEMRDALLMVGCSESLAPLAWGTAWACAQVIVAGVALTAGRNRALLSM